MIKRHFLPLLKPIIAMANSSLQLMRAKNAGSCGAFPTYRVLPLKIGSNSSLRQTIT